MMMAFPAAPASCARNRRTSARVNPPTARAPAFRKPRRAKPSQNFPRCSPQTVSMPWCSSAASARANPQPSVCAPRGRNASSRPEATPALVEDRPACRGADAGDAERPHLEQAVERSHPTGGLDLDVRRRAAPHQPQILIGRTGRPVTCRRLDEVGADLAADSAQLFLVFIGQETVLE